MVFKLDGYRVLAACDLPLGGRRVIAAANSVEAACARRTFAQVTNQVGFRARCTTRLKEAAVEAVLDEGMPIWRACARHRLGWATINAAVVADTLTIPDPDMVPVAALGIDEHRFARAKWFKHPDTAQWCRVEPWTSTFVNADTGQEPATGSLTPDSTG